MSSCRATNANPLVKRVEADMIDEDPADDEEE